ncbi:SpoIIE family protein phosphatase [Streptomyces sp. KR80]|uniref:SpoIIE family protein phosphatase n=1 Tax=Streptomyces sp. KR80 TaxID=3457426 RepID=UPI003FCF8E41
MGGSFAADPEKVAEALDQRLAELGAHVGALYLLDREGQVLELAVTVGLPREFIGPWERMGLAAPLPVPDAVHSGDLVWVPSEEAMMGRYPRVAVAVPYEFALAAVPVVREGVTYGGIFALWPAPQPAPMPHRLHDGLVAIAAGVAQELEYAASAGLPLPSGHPFGPGPREPLIWTRPGPAPGSDRATGRLAARLPEGLFGLDFRGRIVAVNPAATRLLGESADRLLGAAPWDVLPWLRDPVYDRYRAAVVSRRTTSELVLRPPDQWLDLHFYPDESGVSVRVAPARVPGRGIPPPEPLADQPFHARTAALYHVLQLATALTEAIGVQDVVDLVADQIMPAYGGRALAILTVEKGRLRIVGHRGYPLSVLQRFDNTPQYSVSPGAQALASGQPAFFESSEELNQAYPDRRGLDDGMAAWAFLPLIASGRPIGSCVLAYDVPHRFSTTERAVLTSLGGLIAQALDRARLYDTKVALAIGLQDNLLPHALPSIPGLTAAARYVPGTEGLDIGGDFYDLIRLCDGSAAAVIGDVQGHNVTAAALMGQVRTAVRAYAAADADPGQVLGSTNRLLAELDPGLFASCAYLRLDLRHRTAGLAGAGHPYPLLRLPDGEVRALRSSGGVLLGIKPDADYPQTRFPLPAGSTVALYTDGLIERAGVDFEEALSGLAGELEQAGALPLEDLADVLIRGVPTSSLRSDDIALLLLRTDDQAGR